MKACMVFLLCVFGVGAAAGAASAAVYKCTSADGKIEYSDTPCAGADSERILLWDNSFGDLRIGALQDQVSGQASTASAKTSEEKTSNTAKTSTTTNAADKANNRRFISRGMNTAEVISRIGEPDFQVSGVCQERTIYISDNQQEIIRNFCEDCWVYNPAGADSQMRTQVCFQNGQVSSVERKVVR